MGDDIAILTVEYLKRFDTKLDRIENDIRDLKFRIGSMERTLVSVQETLAHHSGRFDRVEERLGRIEKRLDLVDAH